MTELNVYFWGLICHMDTKGGDGAFDAAAMVDVDGHQPRIIFDFNDANNFALESSVVFDHGTRPAESELANTSFADFVPNLKAIVGGEPFLDSNTPYLFHYPQAQGPTGRGKLSVIDIYDSTARHRSKISGKVKRPESRIGKVIRLRVPLADNHPNLKVVFKGTNKAGDPQVEYKMIPADSCILVTNLPGTSLYDAAEHLSIAGNQLLRNARSDKTIADAANEITLASKNLKHFALHSTSKTMNHFEHYSKLLSTADVAIAEPVRPVDPPPTPPQYPCDWVGEYVKHYSGILRDAVAPECGNTQWP